MKSISKPYPSPEESAEHKAAARQMIPTLEGKPAVYVIGFREELVIFVSRRTSDIQMDDEMILWKNDWVDPVDEWVDDIGEELSIGEGCLEVAPGHWFDCYFGAWFIFEPDLVAQSLAGDDSWVGPYLKIDWPIRRP